MPGKSIEIFMIVVGEFKRIFKRIFKCMLKVRYSKSEQNEGVVSFYNSTIASNMARQPDTSWLDSSAYYGLL